MRVDLIVSNIGQLLTCATDDGPKRLAKMRDVGEIANGAVAISGGEFVAVGSSDEILRDFETAEIIDAEGRVVCPGFVDPHTHIVFAGDRLDEFELKIKGADYLEILANGGGIISTVRKTREASIATLIELATKRLDKMLASGTTTCEIKTGYGLDTETELKMLDVIADLDKSHPIDVVTTFLAAHAVPPEFKENADAYVDLICDEMLPKAYARLLAGDGLTARPTFVDVFCEKNAFDVGQSRRVLETAKALGFGLKAHVDEFTNLGGSCLAIELGATSIDHLDAISDEEVKILAESETVGIITPTVNFNFGSAHFADARKLIDAGCAIALSTDYNPGSSPCPSQPMAMSIACRYQKLLPSEAINAATINAAFSIGLGDQFGSIEVGKVADLVVLDTDDYRLAAYEFGGNLIKRVIKAGTVVYGSD
ncbi:MAG TPA: imidazolonepropionase [Pyrinomonadaceae bacterium]|nr:imidazolonepropionase [Pyrinomonadaceae bacterium]